MRLSYLRLLQVQESPGKGELIIWYCGGWMGGEVGCWGEGWGGGPVKEDKVWGRGSRVG